MTETWKGIAEAVEVSDLGRVRRAGNVTPARTRTTHGYAYTGVFLRHGSGHRFRSLARLVLEAFGQPRLGASFEAWHHNDDRTDCRLANLSWRDTFRAEVAKAENARRTVRKNHLARAFGLTPEDYARMLESQGGVCALCRQPEKRRRLAVDHDHATGRIRSLLCVRCNALVGFIEDRPAWLPRVRAYLGEVLA